MVRPEKAATGRRRGNITTKTRLRVEHGNVEGAELVLLEEDENKNKQLDNSGVEHEDAKEEHLVQVLAAAARRVGSARATRSTEEIVSAHIPIPDATGVVDGWQSLYPPNRWHDAANFTKSSDTVEESTFGYLNGAITYDLDERDLEWLNKNNSVAKGEGSSSSPELGRSRSKSSRSKDTHPPTTDKLMLAMSEDEFELIMGLFEKITDDKFPFLHLDVKELPPLTEFEPIFAAPLEPSFFASFSVPEFLKDSAHVQKLAGVVYPHWRDRKLEREGRRIIPQLNLEEANDTDPYICFRRRDAKLIRKTRRADATPADKVARLLVELRSAHELSESICKRERIKLEAAKDQLTVLDARIRLSEIKRRHVGLLNINDDKLLFEPERIVGKKVKQQEQVVVKIARRSKEGPENDAPTSNPYGDPLNPVVRFHQLENEVNKLVDREKKKQTSWEDYIDLPVNLPSGASGAAMFRTILDVAKSREPVVKRNAFDSSSREPRSLRLRSGRGGRHYVDRCLSGRRRPSGPPQSIPVLASELGEGFLEHFAKGVHVFSVDRSSEASIGDQEDDEEDSDDRPDTISALDERWRYDTDEATRGNDEQRQLIDDFEPRYIRLRMGLFGEQDVAEAGIETAHILRVQSVMYNSHTDSLKQLSRVRVEQQRNPTPSLVQRPTPTSNAQTSPNGSYPTPSQNSASPLRPQPPGPSVTAVSGVPTANRTGQPGQWQPRSSSQLSSSSMLIPGQSQQTQSLTAMQPPNSSLQAIIIAQAQAAQQRKNAHLLQQQQSNPTVVGNVTRVGTPSQPQQAPLTQQQITERINAMNQSRNLGSAAALNAAMQPLNINGLHLRANLNLPGQHQSQQNQQTLLDMNGNPLPTRPPSGGAQVAQNSFNLQQYQQLQANQHLQQTLNANVSTQVGGQHVPPGMFGPQNGTNVMAAQYTIAQQMAAAKANGTMNGVGGRVTNGMLPPQQQGQQQQWSIPQSPVPNGVGASPVMNLKLPVGRPAQFNRPLSDSSYGSVGSGNANGGMMSNIGSPVMPHHISSSPVPAHALMNGVPNGNRGSPINAMHSSPSPARPSPSPSSLGPPLHDGTMMQSIHSSPHLTIRSPAS